ncbi:MAG TPA: S24/S26 family peptidase [Chthonomonadaceae bacterium]|nr:S24/S26 family peptidase [Chthonomonadaceae bacterium]
MIAAASLTRDPRRLAALCALWQNGEQEVWITLKGNSMLPTLPPGTRLRLRCHLRDIEIGSIIVYRREESLIVHRLQAVLLDAETGERKFVCKGDGNRSLDPPVPEELLVGMIVASRLPKMRVRLRHKLAHMLGPYRSAAQSLLRFCRPRRARSHEAGIS